jgi:hypothetical protein
MRELGNRYSSNQVQELWVPHFPTWLHRAKEVRLVFQEVSSEIDTVPGNTQMCIFHAVTNFGERRKGLGKLAHYDRLREAKRLGYQVALCTTDAANAAQLKILGHFEWTEVTRFTSKRTGNEVILWQKHL